ncbi:MAG TPA: leucine--tRNA ligase [Candidatus Onthenecus intestinigallinarum]|uniref:Leucine--tRNA ligase n=1 Tax=Candidatus Onthenecus intestinigallinarum TaxID=2840875 RepID=A0A9D0ZAE7_9FIRM|nr:leucine--tRNA ligase [Candidatus Onthenecus intestinigallinarum]
MITPYNPAAIEKKWQKIWADAHAFEAEKSHDKPKFYGLIEFPYPSGAGLHVGHPRSNTALDIICRKRRMEGYNVLYPIGWDAFGLPTENYAIKNHVHPAKVTKENVDHFREQLQKIGFSFDYSREVNTTDPKYYKWTQWIFLRLFERGLAYKAEMPVNWCTSCKCGLANEEVVGGVCERCGGEVVRKVKSQWMLRITDYAQKLLDGLDEVDFIEKVKVQQRNWIGRSEGAEVDFAVAGSDRKIRVYTTRPDTLFGATYMVLAPEHPLLDEMKDRIENWDEVLAYRAQAARKSDFERTELQKDKTGVELKGLKAVNPVTGREIPVWASDYVLVTYGTGAIMAVPAHDTRDWEFAKKFGLPIVEVVAGGNVQEAAYTDVADGVMVNSGFLDGLRVAQAKQRIADFLEEKGIGTRKVNFKLRDWVFSRQRYWGEPIPLVHCDKCGWAPVPESELPVLLPDVDNYEPTDSGESPLSVIDSWVNTTCPHCGGPARRETDTMPQWAGSSWYFLRYIDPHNDDMFAAMDELKYWLPVDWYNGGMEHTTLHLLYSRFWHKFLYDEGYVPTPEPYRKRTSHGMILGANGEKMSKSRGNVINPDDTIAEIGADAFRLYEMFMGAFDQAIPWSTEGARGCRRFLERVWRLQEMLTDGEGHSKGLETLIHQTIKKVSEDYEKMKFNTAIAQMMTLVNEFYAAGQITRGDLRTLLLLLDPVAPHIAEEMWQQCGLGDPIYRQQWPEWDEDKLQEATVEIAVQINGKVRGRITVPAGMSREQAERELPQLPEVQRLIAGKTVKKIVCVPGRLLNVVVG